MSKNLNKAAFLILMPKPEQVKIDIFLEEYFIPDDNGMSPVKSCISKNKAKAFSNSSNGVLIKLKADRKGFDFEKYLTPIPAGSTGQYAIDKDVIDEIFLNNRHNTRRSDYPNDAPQIINSLIAYLCENDTIVVEVSPDSCNGGGAGGDGTKVRIPTG
jgi:hypothetical protein